MKDLRDPQALGERFLKEGYVARSTSFADYRGSQIADLLAPYLETTPNYSANPSPIEKYGRPQDLPPCPF